MGVYLPRIILTPLWTRIALYLNKTSLGSIFPESITPYTFLSAEKNI